MGLKFRFPIADLEQDPGTESSVGRQSPDSDLDDGREPVGARGGLELFRERSRRRAESECQKSRNWGALWPISG